MTGFGDLIELINVLLSTALTLLHIIDTYFFPTEISVIIISEFILYIYFILNFLLALFISENKLLFCFGFSSVLEYLSILPNLFALLGFYQKTKYLFLSQVLRVIFVGKLEKIMARRGYEVPRHLFSLMFALLAVIIIGSTFMYTLDSSGEYYYHDYLYFMIVSITTVGYGDIHPTSTYGQFIMVAIIGVLFIVLPNKLQNYDKATSLRSSYARAYYKKTRNDVDHIILLGSPELEGLDAFFAELYHTDHVVTDIKTILLQSDPPSEELKINLLKNASLVNKITYLEGKVMNPKDLKRCQTETSKCIIILSNKFSTDPTHEDYKNILEAFAIKNYVRKVGKRNIRVCFQVLKPENKQMYLDSLGGDHHDQLICVEELKAYLLAKTCICPGITTIITLLITSTKPNYQSSEPPNESSNWMDEYVFGMQNEIYRIPFEPEKYAGISFALISQQMYRQFEMILFALEIQVDGEIKVFVNPSSYILQDYKHYGYVIASKLPDIEDLEHFNLPNITRNFTLSAAMQHTTSRREEPGFKKSYRGGSQSGGKKKKKKNSRGENIFSGNSKSFYFTKTISLDSVTLNIGDDTKLENHIIVCGIIPNMKQLLLPLRAKSLKNINSILILYNDQFPTSIWKKINRFPKVYYMQGSPMKLLDLERACLSKAQSVVLLSRHNENERNTTMADADTIFIYKTIKAANPNIRIVTELANYSTISVLSSSKNSGSGHKYDKFGQYTISEPFGAGEIYMSFMLDTLICQAFYNPYITYIIEQFIMGDAALSQSERQRYQSLKIEQSNLFLMGVPSIFYDKTFGELYDSLCMDYKMVPLGLYRGVRQEKGNMRPYTYIMPVPTTRIDMKDKVFVLSYKQPSEALLNDDADNQPGRRGNLLKNQVNIKSKLVGEEGKIDTETAKELFRLQTSLNGVGESLSKLNRVFFSHGLTKPELVNRVRKILRSKLSQISAESNI